jgi:hypothetical protein
MKSKIFLILLSIFLVLVSVAQEISKSDIIKFGIKSITAIDSDGKIKYMEFYNQSGIIIKRGSLNEHNQLHIDKEFFYNDSSQLVEERAYTGSGDINSVAKYYYNEKNQLYRKEYIQFGEVSATWTFEYDQKGNKTAEIQKSGTMGNAVTKYKYDEKALLIQEDKSNSTIGKEERVNYKYSNKGQIIEKKTKFYYFNTTITVTYSYNDAGNLTKLYESSSNGVSSTTLCEYNEKGLLVSSTWESSISKTPYRTTYQVAFE